MHLKSCPKLVRSELRLDAVGVQSAPQRSGLFVSHQGALLKTCGGSHGNVSGGRLPFSVISTNTLRCSNATNGATPPPLRPKALSSGGLQLLPSPLGWENHALRLYQTAGEDGDAPLDIWTVIKPGHVREKIAIFASEGVRTEAGGGERTATGGSGSRDRTPPVCANHVAMLGLTRAVKAKGSWEENCSAKRRRRSGSNQNQNIQRDQRTQVPDAQHHAHSPSPRRSDPSPRSGGRWGGGEETSAEEEEQKVSVVEMVAFLELRASERQPDCKPQLALQRSSTTITLSRAPAPEAREGSEVRGEEPESVRVSDMVAKLESECLRRRTEGDLSRSNSLRRTVGRVLLAAGDQSSSPSSCPSKPSVTSSVTSSAPSPPSPGARSPLGCFAAVGTPASALTTPPPPYVDTPPSPISGEARDTGGGGGLETRSAAAETRPGAPPPRPDKAEPLPGLLFLSPPFDSAPPPADSEPHPPRHRTTREKEPAPSRTRVLAISSTPDGGGQSEKRRRRKAGGGREADAAAPPSRRPSASQDFLELRQRLQQLLEPQPYLAVLPHHLLVKIFLLLPTQSLAALKCTCHYFKFVIENYGVRPADSLWVSDPRYRDDPCKQCKRRYGRGDVSLCRWHHKPYCQALPYGPGYWMCCHGAHRDAPGCNVGLHDNRWVPAFHSINVPIYRRSQDDD